MLRSRPRSASRISAQLETHDLIQPDRPENAVPLLEDQKLPVPDGQDRRDLAFDFESSPTGPRELDHEDLFHRGPGFELIVNVAIDRFIGSETEKLADPGGDLQTCGFPDPR